MEDLGDEWDIDFLTKKTAIRGGRKLPENIMLLQDNFQMIMTRQENTER